MFEQLLSFPHSYEVDLEVELPSVNGGSRRYYYPGATTQAGHADFMLLVKPGISEPWYGFFAGPPSKGPHANGVFSCPDPDSLCVVVSGYGYMINVEEPTVWAQIPLLPVLEVRPVTDHSLLLMNDFTGVLAYGPQGQAWRVSPSKVTDDLVIDRIDAGHLHLRGYNYALGDVEAVVHLANGKEL